MATTDRQVVDALRRTAELLLRRSISQSEVDDLVRKFNESKGTYTERSVNALQLFTGIAESTIRTKSASSDNTQAIMSDLQSVLDDWQPGT